MSITQIVNLHAAEGKAEVLLEILCAGRDSSRTVEGCESFDVYQAKDDPNSVMMVERWTTEDAHQAHFEKNVKASGVLDKVAALVTEPPQMSYYVDC